jgi:hypothetical protein
MAKAPRASSFVAGREQAARAQSSEREQAIAFLFMTVLPFGFFAAPA